MSWPVCQTESGAVDIFLLAQAIFSITEKSIQANSRNYYQFRTGITGNIPVALEYFPSADLFVCPFPFPISRWCHFVGRKRALRRFLRY
jgi:uncharacterized membrane protein